MEKEPVGEKQGNLNRFFGCWHLNMSNPITKNAATFKYCMNCGLRRIYDLENHKATGAFYRPSVSEDIHFV